MNNFSIKKDLDIRADQKIRSRMIGARREQKRIEFAVNDSEFKLVGSGRTIFDLNERKVMSGLTAKALNCLFVEEFRVEREKERSLGVPMEDSKAILKRWEKTS